MAANMQMPDIANHTYVNANGEPQSTLSSIASRALAVIRVRVQPNTVGQGIKDKRPGLRVSAGSAEKMFLNW
jgi:hypothetical protein